MQIFYEYFNKFNEVVLQPSGGILFRRVTISLKERRIEEIFGKIYYICILFVRR